MLTTLLVMIIHVYIVNYRAQWPEWPIAFLINLLTYIKASSLLLSKYFNFDFYTYKAPFVRSWPIYSVVCVFVLDKSVNDIK